MKTSKAARLLMADRIILNRSNTELSEANKRSEKQAQYIGTQYDGQEAQILNFEDVEKTKQQAEIKKKETEAKSKAQKEKYYDILFVLVCKNLMRLRLDLIYRANPLTPRLLLKNIK